MPSHRLPTISLGHGSTELEVFLEPTCPFSKRAYAKFRPLLDAVGEDRLTIVIRFVPQPWHLFSGIVTRAILAASAIGGAEAALRALEGVYAQREWFEFDDDHASGPSMDRTPAEVVAEVGQFTGLDLAEAFRLDSVDRALRWHAKYYRQNGVHGSPTFAINRLIEPGMTSGQTVEEWVKLIEPHLEV